MLEHSYLTHFTQQSSQHVKLGGHTRWGDRQGQVRHRINWSNWMQHTIKNTIHFTNIVEKAVPPGNFVNNMIVLQGQLKEMLMPFPQQNI